ncbi:3,4-dihydroxy-2-butanone-4-phosphate synthase [Magnetovibrio blakemorei]|uniref:3,4-dihydroxy-2-butanone 4-phosphate synthase n=1 Tax=Magnetovibrio blakemorei TaxID=28181 RepID=A0A1E5Q4F3_9PROT|nr:3,4-dihydroxy-2-butanone-4-phosphate synthase [Magnetovibrio blakemorei]OEJ64611.1 3,4-dihydroxy-2-butanone-4-phosphate synthase [Magnetovibrio blakemorei]
MPYTNKLSPIEDIIEDARNGRMFILVDDEGRENEGDLVIPAQMATPEAINFMATHGRGLICLTLTRERVEYLDLPHMSQSNVSRHSTAFTVSIEAREGVTTGISASDRAHTVAVAIGGNRGKEDITTPGHVFPLEARDGGVLVRAGHTEAAVDISRLAGLNPSGVICEIMNDDGTMARLDDLIPYAEKHKLKIASIADLIAYRLKNDHVVEKVLTQPFTSLYGGEFELSIYRSGLDGTEHLSLSCGDVTTGGPVLVRMHAMDILTDALGDNGAGKAGILQRSLKTIAEEGRGAVVVIRNPRLNALSERKLVVSESEPGDAGGVSAELRNYGVGAQILLDLGVKEMILLSNTQHTIIGLEGYGLTVAGQKPIPE